MEQWRLIDYESDDPHLNVALEESLARNVGARSVENTIRFWRNPSSVIIGQSEQLEREVKLESCSAIGASVVRRFTGGGTVYQDLGNLNFTMCVRKGNTLLPADIQKSYHVVAEGVIMGLKHLGVEAKFFENEIQLNGKKITGMAGANEFGSILRHGTLLVDTDPGKIYAVISNIKRDVTNLTLSLGRRVSMRDVKVALIRGFEERHAIQLNEGVLTDSETNMAEYLWRVKYSSKDWNWSARDPSLLLSYSELLQRSAMQCSSSICPEK